MTAFLFSLKTAEPVKKLHPGKNDASASRALFQNIRCTACHGENGEPIEGLGSKMNISQISRYLRDPLAIDPSGEMPDLLLRRNEQMQLAAHLVQSRNPPFEEPVPDGDAKRGQTLFTVIGCANCHALTIGNGNKPLQPIYFARKFEELAPGKGCLAETPSQTIPDFHLLARQEVNAMEKRLNNRPRKCLQFRTPKEVFSKAGIALQC